MNTKLKKINDYLKPIDKVYLNIIGMCNYSLSNIGYILDDSMKIQNTVLKNYNSFNFKLNIINQDKIIINTEEFNIKNFLNTIIHDHYSFNNIPEDIYKSIYNNTPNETLETWARYLNAAIVNMPLLRKITKPNYQLFYLYIYMIDTYFYNKNDNHILIKSRVGREDNPDRFKRPPGSYSRFNREYRHGRYNNRRSDRDDRRSELRNNKLQFFGLIKSDIHMLDISSLLVFTFFNYPDNISAFPYACKIYKLLDGHYYKTFLTPYIYYNTAKYDCMYIFPCLNKILFDKDYLSSIIKYDENKDPLNYNQNKDIKELLDYYKITLIMI